jgi:hypothetical protein
LLKAIVVSLNDNVEEIGSVLAIARNEARRREHAELNPPVRALRYFPELCVYVAVYDSIENPVGNVKQTG